jgi:NDP-4-keto-2,6-dideoxyhexose 3-C-methyltransferase
MFYDVPDPGQFLEDVRWALAPDGVFVCQMNYLLATLRCLTVADFCHEHLTYWLVGSFQALCAAHGLTVVKAEANDVNGGSVRLYVRKNGREWAGMAEFVRDEMYYLGNFGWPDFRGGLERMRSAVTDYIAVCLPQTKFGICGASTRGLTLLHYLEIPANFFICAGERDPAKVGRFYGATGIPIVSEAEMRERCEVLLALPYHFSEEIVKREQGFLNSGGRLLFPLPRPRVVTKEGERFL